MKVFHQIIIILIYFYSFYQFEKGLNLYFYVFYLDFLIPILMSKLIHF